MRIYLSTFLLLALTSCSAMGTKAAKYEDINVRSKPGDADVKFSTGEFCMTPCVVARPLGQPFTLAVSKRGYKTRWVKVLPQAEDLARAETNQPQVAAQAFKPNPIFVTLEPDWSK